MVREERIEKLRKVIKDKKVDAALITHHSDELYLTGFGSGGCWLLVSKNRSWIIASPIVYDQVKNEVTGYDIVPAKSMVVTLSGLCSQEKIKSIVFDPQRLTVSFYEYLSRCKNIKFVSQEGLATLLRMVKDENEINCIRQACKISVQAMNFALKKLRVGITEHELVNETEYFIRKNGGDKVAFETIIASGENTVYPHHNPGNRKIKSNEFVVIDLGAVYQGYHSDLTRTVFLGKLNNTCAKIYNSVDQAQKVGVKSLRPGIKTSEIDRQTRNKIKESRLDKYFVHGTGHGVGLEIHELPVIGKKNKTVLQPGMVVTVEPGVYVPGIGGVRIEDTVLITNNGHEVLTV